MQAKTPSKLGSRGEMVRLEKVGCTIALGTVTTVTVSLTREEMKVRPARQYGFQKMEEICAAETEKLEHMGLYVDPSRARFNFPMIKSEARIRRRYNSHLCFFPVILPHLYTSELSLTLRVHAKTL
ncbi:hypothetical protein EV424DRAFT_63966 [Suillus variegatus]|nr:hypothetical protein EV424DRAFT_63966 [Suillus variegatus]